MAWVLLTLAVQTAAWGQTTSGVANDGTATDGQSLWTSKGCSGCHTVSGIRANAANAGGHISYANTQGMGGAAVTVTERNNIAAYIATILTTTLGTQAVPFGGSKMFTAPGITLNTAYGDYIAVRTSTNPATRGTVSYSGTSVTYTANAGQCGTDTFSYEAYRSGASVQGSGTSSERSVTMDIADPAAPNITTSSGIDSGTYNTAGFSYTPTSTGGPVNTYAISAGTLPSGLNLNSSSGAITGTPTQTGTFNVTLQARNCLSGNLTGQTSSRAISITIGKANQGALTALINGSSANPTFTYLTTTTATLSTSQVAPVGSGTVTYSSGNTAVCTVTAPSTLNLVGAGNCVITATRATDTNYLQVSDTITVTVNKANQATFTALIGGSATPAPVNYQFPPVGVALTTTGGSGTGAVSFVSNTASVCSVSGSTVTYLAAGTCTVTATKATDTNYNAASDPVSITINGTVPGAPVIGAVTPGNQVAVVNFSAPSNTGGSAITSYTAACTPVSTGTPGSVSGATSPITVTGLTNGSQYNCNAKATNITGDSAPSSSVLVTPLNNPTFTSPSSATRTITVAGTTNITATSSPLPVITLASGTLPTGLTFTPGTGTATITGTPAAGTAGAGNSQNYPLVFNATNNGGSTNFTQNFTLTVQKASQTITLTPMADRPMTPVPFTAMASASSGLPVGFSASGISAGVCTVSSGGVVTLIGLGTCRVRVDQVGNTSYSAAPVVADDILVTQGMQLLTWNSGFPASISFSPGTQVGFGAKASSVDPTDMVTSTGLDPSYSSITPSVCDYTPNYLVTVLAAGVCTIQVDQAGDANYAAAAPITSGFTVDKAPQVISWGTQASQSYGTGGTFSISPLATGGASGNSIVYGTSTPSVCAVAGTTVTKLRAGTCTLTADQAGNGNYLAAPQVTRNVTINPSLPSAPTATGITASDAQVAIEYTDAAQDGGATITQYIAVCNPSLQSVAGTSSPLIVTGLPNNVQQSCVVKAVNAAGTGPSSNALLATPFLDTGTNIWANVCSGCHGAMPAGVRFNAAGTTGTVINYVRNTQPSMLASSSVQALTLNELAEVAKYIETFVPVISLNTAFNTPVNVDVSSHLTLGGVAFEYAEVVSGPSHGSLGAFTGTMITYTPSPGYTGVDTFTYRGNHSAPGVPGDAHTVTITIAPPPAPVITSATTFNATYNSMAIYQITATNSPASYGVSGLGGANCFFNSMNGFIDCTPMATGTFMITVSATNAGGTGMQVVTVTVSKANQTLFFMPQAGQTYSPGATFGVGPLASSTSPQPITYSSLTTGVCTVSGTTVTMVSAGTCTIAADQAGNANYNAALQVTQNVIIAPTVPDAPTIGMATAGDTQAAIAFTPPINTGGIPITSYTAGCNPGAVTANGGASPITVTGLINNTPYTCAVRATNAQGNSVLSGTVMVTPQNTPVPPQITSANSTTFTVGSLGSFSVTATGVPAPAVSATGTLPTGVTFTPGTGSATLSGTPALGTVGSYPLTITADGTNPDAMQSFTLTVQKANQSISFTNPGTQTFTTGTVMLSASSTSGLTVSFASNTTSVCTVAGTTLSFVTVGVCSITASQVGNANYNAATDITRAFSVNAANQTITFNTQVPASRNFLASSTFNINPLASASSGLAVLYSSTTTGVCTVAGTTVTMVTPGMCTVAANQGGNANYNAALQVTQSISLNATVPGAPTIGTATPGNAQASIAFTAPSNNGGSAILDYTATCTPGPIGSTGSASPIVVTGLTNNTVYTCSVTARNAVGSSVASATVNVTPLSGQGITTWNNVCSFCHGSVPIGNQLNGAGTSATVIDYVRSNQTLMKAFPPVQNLSLSELADVAAYIATELPDNVVSTPMNTAVPVSVSGHITLTAQVWSAFNAVEVVTPPAHGMLSAFTGTSATYTPTNGYTGPDSFTYRGKLNGVHAGDPQTVTISVTPPAPSITSALTANGTLTQAFNYQITASNTPTSFNALSLPAGLSIDTMTGLISGTPSASGSFNVPISATNAGGAGNANLMLTINLVPQTINFPVQSPATRSWSVGSFPVTPIATGGSSGNAIVYGSQTPSVCTVSGTTVTIVSAGSCTLTADQAGNATYAAATQVTRSVTITPAAPGAPTIGTATAGNTQATVTFTAPASNGGAAFTGFTATANPGGATGTCSAPCTQITVTGLSNGTGYSFTVTATNAAALTGASSAPSNNVTPATVPGAPTIGTATAGNSQATVTFSAPGSNGGAAITSYWAMANPGGATGTCMAPCTQITVTGLVNGTAYTLTVAAANSAGIGAESAPSNSVVPVTQPGAPIIGTVVPGNASASVSFSPPSSDGGLAITSYTATCGSSSASGPASPVVVTGLVNGVTVTCSVTATNGAMLTGPASTGVMVTPQAIQFANNVYSRKLHANGVTGDITIDHNIAPMGAVSIEPRAGSATHTIYFDFTSPVVNAGNVVVTDVTSGLPISGPAASASGNAVVVTLTGVPETARITVALSNVNGAAGATASLGLLVGDVNGTGKVTAADIAAIKAHSALTVSATNYKYDINVSGTTINSADISSGKARAGQVLP